MVLALTISNREVKLSEEEAEDFARRIAANASKLELLLTDLLDLGPCLGAKDGIGIPDSLVTRGLILALLTWMWVVNCAARGDLPGQKGYPWAPAAFGG